MVNFPVSLDDNTTLYVAVNNLRTRLTAALSDTDTTALVEDTTGFPSTGYISILTGADITNTEAISYTGLTPTSFTGLGRGADGTTAVEHNVNDNVDLTIVADHHNALKNAVINLENMLGASGSENFVPFIDGNVVQGNVSLAGTLATDGDFDFKAHGAVSGSMTVGELPQSTSPDIAFVVEEGQISVANTGGSFVDIGVETGPLAVGANLLFYRASSGSAAANTPTVYIKCVFNAADIGEAQDAAIASNGGAWGGTDLAGWKIVTGDGVSTAKLQVAIQAGTGDAVVSAASIMAIPLGDMGLVEGVDYWQSSTEGIVQDAVGGGETTVDTMIETLPEDGGYIYLGTSEAKHDSGPWTYYTIYRYTTPGEVEKDVFLASRRESGFYKSNPIIRLLSLNQGSNTFAVYAQANTGGTASWRRTRQCVIKASSFDQVVGNNSFTDSTTSSSTFSKLSQTEISYTPNTSETIVVFGNVWVGINTTSGPPAAAYKLVNETDGTDYLIDASPGQIRDTSDRVATYLFTKLDNLSTTRDFSLSFREPEATGQTITHLHDNMLVWSMSTTATSSIQFTSLDGDAVRTPFVDADLVDGALVTGDLISGPHINGDPLLSGDNLAIQTVATISGLADVGWLTISGTTVADGYSEFKDNVVVSGSLTVGEYPVSSVSAHPVVLMSEVIHPAKDTDPLVGDGTWQDLDFTSGPLPAGNNLVLFRATAGDTACVATKPAIELRAVFAGTELGYTINSSPIDNPAWNTAELVGFRVVAGNGVDSVSLQHDVSNANCTINIAARAIVGIPLDALGLVENTDYFYFEEASDATFGPYTDWTTFGSDTFNLPESGDYIVFGYAEGASRGPTIDNWCRFRVGGNVVSPVTSTASNTVAGADRWRDYTFARLLTLSAGNTLFEVQGMGDSTTGYNRRGRMLAIKASKFDQVSGFRKTPEDTNSTTSFSEVSGSSITHVPNQREDIIVIANPHAFTVDTNSNIAYKLRNETTGTDYNVDAIAPTRNSSLVGRMTTLLFTVVNTIVESEWSLYHRETEGTSDPVTTSGINMIVWSTTPAPASTPPIGFTTIDVNKVRAHLGDFDLVTVSGFPVVTGTTEVSDPLTIGTVNVTTSLTVSGVPVATGTSGGGGSSNITSINSITSGDITIGGTGSISVTTAGQDITISGSSGGDFLGAVIYKPDGSGDQAVTDGSEDAVTYGGTHYDVGGWIDDVNTTRLTVPSGLNISYVNLNAQVSHGSIGATDAVRLQIKQNGNTVNPASLFLRQGTTASTTAHVQMSSFPLPVNDGDYFELFFLNNTGSSVNVLDDFDNTWFAAHAVQAGGNPQNIVAQSGTFIQSLTVSGIPVATGVSGGGSGSSNIDSINAITSGDIVIGGSGGIAVNTAGQNITIDGSGIPVGGGGEEGVSVASGTMWLPDAPPPEPSDYNDEFDDGSIDAKWTEWDPGSNLSLAERADQPFLRFSWGVADEFSGAIQSVPTPDQDWHIWSKLSLGLRAQAASDEAWVGLGVFEDAIANPSTSDFAGIWLRIQEPSANVTEFISGTFTDYTSAIGGATTLALTNFPLNEFYLRIRYLSGTSTIDCDVSVGGTAWVRIGSIALSYDPKEFGILGKKVSGGATSAEAHFFREGPSSGLATIPNGARIALYNPDQELGVSDPIVLASGIFTQSLTVSGTPVATGTNLFRGVQVYKTSNQTISDDTLTEVTWDAAEFDTDGFFDPSDPTRLIVPADKPISKVRLSGGLVWAVNNTGGRELRFFKDGSAAFRGNAIDRHESATGFSANSQYNNAITGVVTVSGGDTFSALARQGSTGSLDVQANVATWFQLEVIE